MDHQVTVQVEQVEDTSPKEATPQTTEELAAMYKSNIKKTSEIQIKLREREEQAKLAQDSLKRTKEVMSELKKLKQASV